MPTRSELFQRAIARIDKANGQDPNVVKGPDGEEIAKELLYSQRMTRWQEQLYPDASEPLALAARAQHICRWQKPRSDYPEGRKGYRQWRTDMGAYHADITGAIMRVVGYDEATIATTRAIIRKEQLKQNPETQRLEDIACLVFMEHHLEEFVEKYQYDDEKMLGIIRKTWKKMSDKGRQAALTIDMPDPIAAMVQRALA